MLFSAEPPMIPVAPVFIPGSSTPFEYAPVDLPQLMMSARGPVVRPAAGSNPISINGSPGAQINLGPGSSISLRGLGALVSDDPPMMPVAPVFIPGSSTPFEYAPADLPQLMMSSRGPFVRPPLSAQPISIVSSPGTMVNLGPGASINLRGIEESKGGLLGLALSVALLILIYRK